MKVAKTGKMFKLFIKLLDVIYTRHDVIFVQAGLYIS